MCYEGRLDPDAARVRRLERKRQAARERYRRNPEAFKARAKAWAANNADHIKALAKIRRDKWRAANPELDREVKRRSNAKPSSRKCRRNNMLRIRYGITPGQYDALVIACSGRCAVCGIDPGNGVGRGLSVDHDHATGAVRSMLCPACNKALGMVNDSVERLDQLKAYLLLHKEK